MIGANSENLLYNEAIKASSSIKTMGIEANPNETVQELLNLVQNPKASSEAFEAIRLNSIYETIAGDKCLVLLHMLAKIASFVLVAVARQWDDEVYIISWIIICCEFLVSICFSDHFFLPNKLWTVIAPSGKRYGFVEKLQDEKANWMVKIIYWGTQVLFMFLWFGMFITYLVHSRAHWIILAGITFGLHLIIGVDYFLSTSPGCWKNLFNVQAQHSKNN